MDGKEEYQLVGEREVALDAIRVDERIGKKRLPKTTDPDIVRLAKSIRTEGLKNSPVVELICRPSGPYYRILNGHHRRAALELLGARTVRVIVVVKIKEKRFRRSQLVS